MNAHNWFHPQPIKAQGFIPSLAAGVEDYQQALRDWTVLARKKALTDGEKAVMDSLDTRLTAWEDRPITRTERERLENRLEERRRSPR